MSRLFVGLVVVALCIPAAAQKKSFREITVEDSSKNNRVVIDGDALKTYDASGNIKVQIDTATGNVHTSGTLPGGQGARVLNVAASGAQYTTIQAAIDAVPSGRANPETTPYVVQIGPGVYDETVDLNEAWVTLRGAGRDATIIRHTTVGDTYVAVGDGNFPVQVTATNCALENLTVENPSTDLFGPCVMVGNQSATTPAENCSIRGCRAASLSANARDAIWVHGGGDGFELRESIVFSKLDCVSISDTDGAVIANCEIRVTGARGGASIWNNNVTNAHYTNIKVIGVTSTHGIVCGGTNTMMVNGLSTPTNGFLFQEVAEGQVGTTARISNCQYGTLTEDSNFTITNINPAEAAAHDQNTDTSTTAEMFKVGAAQPMSDNMGLDTQSGGRLRYDRTDHTWAAEYDFEDEGTWTDAVFTAAAFQGSGAAITGLNVNNMAGVARVLYANVSDSQTVTGGTSEVDFNTSVSIASGSFTAGRVLKVKAGISVADSVGWAYKLYLGSTLLGTFTTALGSQTAGYLVLDATVTCRTTGAPGTAMVVGELRYIDDMSVAQIVPVIGSVTINTTVANVLKLSVTPASSSSSDVVQSMVVEWGN